MYHNVPNAPHLAVGGPVSKDRIVPSRRSKAHFGFSEEGEVRTKIDSRLCQSTMLHKESKSAAPTETGPFTAT